MTTTYGGAIRALSLFLATEAAINLKDGETLQAYSQALEEAARQRCLSMLCDMAEAAGYDPTLEDMGHKDPEFRCWSEDAGADFIVMRAYRDHPYASLLLKMPYTRDAAGVFDFGAHQVVTVKRTFEPAPEGEQALSDFIGVGLPASEAVEKPTTTQRRNLPASAFAAPFLADAAGKYAAGGTFQRSKSKLPFHVNTAKSVDAMETVDVPRLRNALARFDQTDFSEFGDAAATVKAKAKSRLDKAAKALLPTVKAAAQAGEAVLRKLPGAPTKADADALVVACEAFERIVLTDDCAASLVALAEFGRRSVASAVPASESAEVQRSASAVLERASAA